MHINKQIFEWALITPFTISTAPMFHHLFLLTVFISRSDPKRKEAERGNSENVFALSAGAHTTTWLMMVVHLLLCPKARFLGMETKILYSLLVVMVYSALFNNVI